MQRLSGFGNVSGFNETKETDLKATEPMPRFHIILQRIKAWLKKLEAKNGLEQGANTRYLLHGTKPQHVDAIKRRGLRTAYTRLNGGSIGGHLYGHGLYFTTSSCKANQYSGMETVDSASKSHKTGHILICRVVLGRPKLLETTNADATDPPDGYHSTYVNSTTKHNIGTHAYQLHDEYIVFNDIECYPEFHMEVECDWH